ncbi:50S ribosomal protein L23 [Ruminococcaceae bacterium OttesenSCG-928-L11]|nr:50S ribosomal protein L23 [Ruminococcaceae bacterium OttesenSCG-928-L11]
MTKTPHDIILAPVITERSMGGIGMSKYTFKVAKDANKIEIGKAVESLFPGTKVASVNTMHVRGQMRRQGRNSGYTASWKKAIVTLKEGSKGIEFFESMT